MENTSFGEGQGYYYMPVFPIIIIIIIIIIMLG
jgi:hypothetical protein